MIHLNLDSEQAMLILIAAEASNALLRARLHRVDPGNVISNSAILQDHKIEQLKRQIESGTIADWEECDEATRKQVLYFADLLIHATDQHTPGLAYRHLRETIMSARSGKIFIGDRQYLPKG